MFLSVDEQLLPANKLQQFQYITVQTASNIVTIRTNASEFLIYIVDSRNAHRIDHLELVLLLLSSWVRLFIHFWEIGRIGEKLNTKTTVHDFSIYFVHVWTMTMHVEGWTFSIN